jgi:CubicO group peptidase (beta-lactamase class C family)
MPRLILAAAAGLLIHISPTNAFSWDSTKEQQTLQLVKDFQVAHKVPSIAVGVTVDGKTVLTRGLDAKGAVVPGGESVRYNIGSVTKQFTAATVLAMIEDKTIVPKTKLPLTLDTTGVELFPGLDPPQEGGKITVRRLLTMTSNIPSYTDDDAELMADQSGVAPAAQPIDVPKVIERLKTYKLTTPPGKFEYSNTNYFVLALVVAVLNPGNEANELVTHHYVRERILARAGLSETGFVGDPLPSGAVAAPPTYLHPRFFDQGAWPKGAGDMVSTAADMARWNIALATGKVISRASLRMMGAPAAAVTTSAAYSGCSYGMGVYVCKRPSYTFYQHDGVIAGFMASTALGHQQDGSWMSATVLANIDASIDIVELVRNILTTGAR